MKIAVMTSRARCEKYSDKSMIPEGAELVAVTKGDLVSRAARERFYGELRKRNPRVSILSVNGVTGQGAASLLRQLRFREIDTP